MLQRPSFDRKVHVTKLDSNDTRTPRQGGNEVLLGPTNVLALEMESLRDVLYLKKSEKSTMRKDPNNPNNLQPGEKILARFAHEDQYYEMLCEVMEARTQNEVIRPLEFIRQERGIPLNVVNYSTGGCLIESNPDLLKFLLGPVYSEELAAQPDYSDPSWEGPLNFLRTPIVQLVFYPKLHFPDAVKRFEPELPFKICLGAQIIRSYLCQIGGRQILQHGLQFAYDLQNTPIDHDDIVPWRYTRAIRDNESFKRVHSNMSQLYGFIENHNLFKKNQ